MDKLLICTGLIRESELFSFSPDVQAFAWDSEAVDSLEKLNVNYITVCDTLPSNPDEKTNLDVLLTLKKCCNEVDSQLQKYFSFLKQYDFYPITAQSTALRKDFFKISQATKKLSSIKLKYPNSELEVLGSGSNLQLIKFILSKINYSEAVTSSKARSLFSFNDIKLNNTPLWKRILKIFLKKGGPSSIFSYLKLTFKIKLAPQKTVLILSDAYDMPSHTKELFDQGYRVIHWSHFKLFDKSHCCELPSIEWPSVVIEGLDLSIDFREACLRHLEANLNRYLTIEEKIKTILNYEEVALSISNYFSPDIDFINAILNKQGIKTYYLLHGGNLGIVTPLPPIPILFRPTKVETIYCVYGNKIKEHVESYRKYGFHIPNIKILRSKYFDQLEKQC